MNATIRAALLSTLVIAGLAAGATAPQTGSNDELVFRRIWTSSTGSYYFGLGPPANGRWMSAVDVSGDVSLYDLASGEYRRLTSNGPDIRSRGTALTSVIAPDGARVAYDWCTGGTPDDTLCEIRVIGTDGSNERTLISERGVPYSPAAWADNGTILLKRGAGGRELMLVSAVDGATRTLHRFESGRVGNVAASPDGRWIAYTFRPDAGGDADVYVLPMSGGEPSALVRGNGNDQLMGWMPDGSGILFYSNRELTRAIWKLAVRRNGRPVGDPELVRADVWDLDRPVGFSGNQYFYLVIRASAQIRTATIDAEAGTVVNPPSPIRPPSEGWSREPAWSPDGRYLSFIDYPADLGSDAGQTSESRLGIRSVHTGEMRYQPFPFEAFTQPWWVPDAQTLTVFGRHQGRPGIYRYDLQSGRVTRLLDRADGENGLGAAPDGSRYYFHRQRRELYARDLTTGEETLLAKIDGLWRRIGVSPDGELLAVRAGGCMEESRLLVLPASGGEPREIYRGMDLGCSDFLDITPDKKYVIAAVFSPTGSGVWRFSIDGGEPVKLLDADPRGFRMSPDGRRVAYWSWPNPEGAREMWVIEGLAGRGVR